MTTRFAAKALALATAYALVARVGLLVAPVAGFATLVWPPTGIALAALLVGGYRFWPGVALGALVANLWVGAPPVVALGISAGNTVEALLGAFLVRRVGGFDRAFDRLRHVLALVVLAAVASTCASATLGVASLVLGDVVPPSGVVETWSAWWVGDGLGALIVAPLLLAWSDARGVSFPVRRRVEAAALAVALVAASALAFGQAHGNAVREFLAVYMLMPLLLWAALRFAMRGATAAVSLVSTIAVFATVEGRGPFAEESLSHGLLLLQLFMAITAITVLVLAAVIVERAEAIRRREEFVAMVSHDLRNPLSALSMASRSLSTLIGAGEHRAEHALSVIARAVDRMTSLVRDLLDLAALQDGFLRLQVGPHDACAIASDTAELMAPLAAERSQRLSLQLPGDPTEVLCDRERLVQALSNLVGNALKFTPEGGGVTMGVERSGDEVRFSVADTGPGISVNELPHIFDRFWKTQRTEAGQGVGLGLSIVKALTEAHGGTVSVESRVGAGSVFRVTLRAAPAPHGAREPRSHGSRWGSVPNPSR